MLSDLVIRGVPIVEVAARAAEVEALGFDAVGVTETNGNPFLAAAQAAQGTSRARVATAIALAFTRSPMDVAYTAWDLQALAGGRFALGLGSQVRAHVERRYGAVWSRPAVRMREYILALGAIWDAWESGGEVDFRGEFYSHTLMPPNFRPLPLGHPRPPVLLAGVRERMTEVAGEVADGFLGHAFSTEEVLREVTLPALERGLERAGRRGGGGGTSRSRPPSSLPPRRMSGRPAAGGSPSMVPRPGTATSSSTTVSAPSTIPCTERRERATGRRWPRSSTTTCCPCSPSGEGIRRRWRKPSEVAWRASRTAWVSSPRPST